VKSPRKSTKMRKTWHSVNLENYTYVLGANTGRQALPGSPSAENVAHTLQPFFHSILAMNNQGRASDH
jgi:hypothetical protein